MFYFVLLEVGIILISFSVVMQKFSFRMWA